MPKKRKIQRKIKQSDSKAPEETRVFNYQKAKFESIGSTRKDTKEENILKYIVWFAIAAIVIMGITFLILIKTL